MANTIFFLMYLIVLRADDMKFNRLLLVLGFRSGSLFDLCFCSLIFVLSSSAFLVVTYSIYLKYYFLPWSILPLAGPGGGTRMKGGNSLPNSRTLTLTPKFPTKGERKVPIWMDKLTQASTDC